jgi:hypothetical protein
VYKSNIASSEYNILLLLHGPGSGNNRTKFKIKSYNHNNHNIFMPEKYFASSFFFRKHRRLFIIYNI